MINTEQRRTLWMEKRVFYLTPQVMVNDLKSGLCKAELIKCIVFDEAHRAVKDYAYCQVKYIFISSLKSVINCSFLKNFILFYFIYR